MKKILYIILILIIGFSAAHIMQVQMSKAAAFPSTDYPWTLNDILGADWLNTVEEILGVWNNTSTNISSLLTSSTSRIGAISNLATTTGNIIVANSSTVGGWLAVPIGTAGQRLTVSSTATSTGYVAWENVVTSAFSTSSAHEWAGLQGFNGGLDFTTATGTSASSTLSAASSTFTNLTLGSLTASRLLQSSAGRVIQAVADLTSWIAGTASEITVADDGDGTVTISLPTTVDLGASSQFTVVSASTTNITASGYGLFPSLSFTNATGTRLGINVVSSTGIEASSTARFANATASRCARFDSSNVLVAASGDCTAGDTVGGGGGSNSFSVIFYPRNAAFPTSSFPSLDRLNNVQNQREVLAFDGAADERVWFDFSIPSYLGTVSTATLTTFWTATSSNAVASTTHFTYGILCLGNDEAIITAYTQTASSTDTVLAANDMHVTAATGPATSTLFSANDECTVELFRDVSEDTLSHDALWIRAVLDLLW